MFRHVIMPGPIPGIFAGLLLVSGTAIIAIIAIEFVRAKQGAGFLILYSWEVLMPEKRYAALVDVMLPGILLWPGVDAVSRPGVAMNGKPLFHKPDRSSKTCLIFSKGRNHVSKCEDNVVRNYRQAG